MTKLAWLKFSNIKKLLAVLSVLPSFPSSPPLSPAPAVNIHIKNLRDRIDRPFANPIIHTVYGIGYKLDI